MRQFALIILCCIWVLNGRGDLHACGNKILAGGRGLRYRLLRSNSQNPSILLYKNANLPEAAPINDPKLYSALQRAGHNLKIAWDLSEFDASLISGKYDLVVADESDIAVLKESLNTSPSKPLLVPLIVSSKKLASKKITEDDYLKYIGQVMDSKQR